MKRLPRIYIYIILFIVSLNMLSYFLFIRTDFTHNKQYSLSKASKEVIKQVNRPVAIDFYVSKDLPVEARKIAKEFMFLIKEYKSLSKTHFNLTIIHPEETQQKIEAEDKGIIPVIVEEQESNYEKIHNIYMGAVFNIGAKQHVISFIDQTTPLEYEITRILKQSFDTLKPNVAFITGHQEATFPLMPQLINPLSELADITTINLYNLNTVNPYDVLCIIAPKDFYTAYEIDILNKYLASGGRIFIALSHAIGQISSNRNTGFTNKTGLEDFLEEKGLKIQNDFIVDNSCGSITIDHYRGFARYEQEIRFPYLVKVTNFSDHIITKGLSFILLPFVSSMKQVKTNTTYIYTPLATSSAISGVQNAPIFFDLQKHWSHRDFNAPHSTVAALLTNEDNNSSIIAVSNANFLINDIGLYSHTLRPDNINFIINSIEWLSDNSGLIKLRNSYTSFSSLESIEWGKRLFLQYLNFLLPIFAISIIAAIRFQNIRNKRIKRMTSGYID